MGFVTIGLIAVGLAMDAFAVSIVNGAVCKQLNVKQAFRIASFFGGFQALMPLIGYLAGLSIKEYIGPYNHWVAFGLLSGVGGRMVYESFRTKTEHESFGPLSILSLLVLSVATSIDALVVGITLPFLRISIAMAVIVIGLVTFALSFFGVFVGKRFGHLFENKIEAVGGVVLIGLGLKILFEHVFF